MKNLWKIHAASFEGVVHLGNYKFPDINGQNARISGENGSGKSLLAELIGIALNPTAATRRTRIVAKDKARLELILVRENEEGGKDELEIVRQFERVDGTDKVKGQPSVKLNGSPVPKPGTYLSGLAKAHNMNLVNIAQDPTYLRDLILSKHSLKIKPTWLQEHYDIDLAGYDVPKEIWDLHALMAVEELTRADKGKPGHLYAIRTNFNDEKRRLEHSAETINDELPGNFDPDYAKKLNISALAPKLQSIEENNKKIKELDERNSKALEDWKQAKQDAENCAEHINQSQTAIDFLKARKSLLNESSDESIVTDWYNSKINRLVGEVDTRIEEYKSMLKENEGIRERSIKKMDEAKAIGTSAKAELKDMKEQDSSDIRDKIAEYDNMKSNLRKWEEQQQYLDQASEADVKSRDLTKIINTLRNEVMTGLIKKIDAPVALEGGKLCILIDDKPVPVEDLSDAQKVLYYLDILVTIEEEFGSIIIEEGRADFTEDTQVLFDKKIKKLQDDGWQIIRTKADSGKLKVEKA